MKKHLFLSITVLFLIVCSVLTHNAQAQVSDEPNGFNINHSVDLTAGFGGGSVVGIGWNHFWGIGKRKNFRLGYGARFGAYNGKNREFVPAPLSLIEETDHLDIEKVRNRNIAINANIKYRIKEVFEVGFNIDLIGISFGPETDGVYHSANIDDASLLGPQTAKPTPVTLLLGGSNDRGMLQSEFYVGYWWKMFNFRAGFNYLFSEYTTTNTLANDNDRFRHITGMPFIGIGFSPKHN